MKLRRRPGGDAYTYAELIHLPPFIDSLMDLVWRTSMQSNTMNGVWDLATTINGLGGLSTMRTGPI